MSKPKKWRVVGPEGVNVEVEAESSGGALLEAFDTTDKIDGVRHLMHLAGYRAEPIEEPKMMSVRFDDLSAVMEMAKFAVTNPLSDLDPYDRLRAALAAQEGEK